MNKLKYKVGDAVTIRRDLAMDVFYGCSPTDSIGVSDEMIKQAGKEAMIIKIVIGSSGYYRYHIDLVGENWYWTDEMFEEHKKIDIESIKARYR